MTPLHYAAKAPSPAYLSILLEDGARVSAKNRWNQSPLNVAYHSKKDSSFATALLDHGADVNEKGYYNSTALTNATFMNDVSTARLIPSHGADTSYQDHSGVTPSIENNSHQRTSLALNSDADLSIADQVGETPLHVIARCADLESLRIFQAADLEDVDLEARRNAEKTARDLFAQRLNVPAEVEKAFQRLVARLVSKSSFVGFFDGVEEMSKI